MDVSNGSGIGVSLFVQGCRFHCKNCFNPETWSFNGGRKWTNKSKDKFLELASEPYIVRVSILGGEPLEEENVYDVLSLLHEIKNKFPDKEIWLYTGFTWNQIFKPAVLNVLDVDRDNLIKARKDSVSMCDVLVDGKYIDELNNISLKWCGSSNQNVIDVQKTLATGEIVLYNN
jgi:anaerobic ribonucleoside-triphosphate reductase activating protein